MKTRIEKKSLLQALCAFAKFLFGFATILLLSGFLVFLISIKTAQPPETLQKADGIVVLTGAGGGRLDTAANLLKQGYAERLLISGVNPNNDAETIRSLLNLDTETFSCCIDLDYEANNTVDNAIQTASWVNTMGYERIILVTSSYHMPRAKLEISSANRNIKIIPYPVKSIQSADEPWWGGVEKNKRLFREFGKLLVSFIRDPGRRASHGAEQ